MADEHTGTKVAVDGPFANPDDLRFAEAMAAFSGSFWTGMTDYVSGLSDLDTALAEIDDSWPR